MGPNLLPDFDHCIYSKTSTINRSIQCHWRRKHCAKTVWTALLTLHPQAARGLSRIHQTHKNYLMLEAHRRGRNLEEQVCRLALVCRGDSTLNCNICSSPTRADMHSLYLIDEFFFLNPGAELCSFYFYAPSRRL